MRTGKLKLNSKIFMPQVVRGYPEVQVRGFSATRNTDALETKLAVLFQAINPPVINGVRKPVKPGGYRDSGADIAYVLQKAGVSVVTPEPSPNPRDDRSWCFPDSEDGIFSALSRGANTLWANTILFSSHPLQTSSRLPDYLRLIGQPPNTVEKYDDKALTNDYLRQRGDFTLPQAWTVSAEQTGFFETTIKSLPYPVVAKPIRGRGSHGVKVCSDSVVLRSHATELFAESPEIMIEQFLPGEEATITVMPPGTDPSGQSSYWSLPVVTRFNHEAGVAPYNGVVAVMANSRVVSREEYAADLQYARICKECENTAELLQTTAPIRIDVRRVAASKGAKFAMFDINMKPNMTGPGRPGRKDQASLTVMAAQAIGWDYSDFLKVVLSSARSLSQVRQIN